MKKIFILTLFCILLLGSISALTQIQGTYLQTNLDLDYELDATSGDVVDEQGNYTGINNGATRGVTGIINNGFEFLRTNSEYVNTTWNPNIGSGTDFSIDFWVNSTDTGVGNDFMGARFGSTDWILISKTAGDLINFRTRDGGTNNDATSLTDVVDGTFHHICLVRDAGNKIEVYVDGVSEANTSETNSLAIDLTTNPFILGAHANSGAPEAYYTGRMDQVHFWTSKALNSTECQDLYNSGSALPFTGGDLPPGVELISPENNSKQTVDSITFISQITPSSGQNVTNETLQIWYDNGTLFLENTSYSWNLSVFNATWNILGFSYGQDYLWNVIASSNNSADGTSTNNLTFTASAFQEDAQVYNSSVLETSGQTFTFEITASSDVNSVSGVLWYNGSSDTSTLSDGTGGGLYNLTNTIDISLQESGESADKSFFWQLDFTFSDSSTVQQNSSTFTQEVNRTYIELCDATYPTPIINFTTKDAENPFPVLDATFKSAWDWHVSSGTGNIQRNNSHEDVNENVNEFDFCTKNYTESFQVYSNIEVDATAYAKNFHYLSNATITNTTEEIDLYLLNDSKATLTILEVRDSTQNPLENILIQIQLYDIGTDTFYTIGMAKTSFAGEDVVYLNWYDSLYKFILIQNGSVVKTTNPYKISESPQIFEIEDTVTFSFEKFRNFLYSLVYNDATSNFVLTFTKPSGLVDDGCLRVTKRTPKGDTEICLTCESSSSATLYCNIGSEGNGTFIATFYATGSYYLIDWIAETIGESFSDEIFALLGTEDATAYAFLFSGVVVSMFLISPVLAVIGAILGLLGAAALGFTLFDYSIYMGMVILGGIVIWILRR